MSRLRLSVAAGALFSLAAQAQPPQHGGIWKAAVPADVMQAEFAGNDPVGVANGARIQADCSLNWVNPDTGKRYCFSSGTSLNHFLDMPQAQIEKADKGWQAMQADSAALAPVGGSD